MGSVALSVGVIETGLVGEVVEPSSSVATDAAAVYPAVLDELLPEAGHPVEQYANNRIEADHGQLKHRLRPMRGSACTGGRPGRRRG
jgi:hypothetical protein